MKMIKRFVYFISIFLLFIIFKELAELYVLVRSIHPVLGYLTLAVLLGFMVYFIAIPVYKIIKIPKNYAPTKNISEVPEIIRKRIENLKGNPFLIKSQFDFNAISADEESFNKIIQVLGKEGEQIRKRYVLQLFYSSSISQNGFLDAILILSSSVNLIKELFILYHGRVSNKDLLAIAKKVYFSMAIGGSEGVEYATQEFFSKFATDSFKSIPFADKIFGSLADGFVNAALLTRISLITENYCKKVYLKSEKDLYPSPEFIIRTTKFITADILDKMVLELFRMSKERTIDYVMLAVNPVGHVFSRTMEKVMQGTNRFAQYQIDVLKDAATIANKPIVYGLNRITGIFKRKRI